MQVLAGLPALLGGGAAAAGTAATAGAGLAAAQGLIGVGSGVGAAASGLSLASILQGTATVLGVVSAIGAGNADAAALEAQAIDAEREMPLETLQGISRRTSIRKAMADALGAQDVAYAASGVDLSYGTARAARRDAYREADLALSTDVGTEQTRILRLSERAASYRRGAKQARRAGVLNGLLGGIKGAMQLQEIG